MFKKAPLRRPAVDRRLIVGGGRAEGAEQAGDRVGEADEGDDLRRRGRLEWSQHLQTDRVVSAGLGDGFGGLAVGGAGGVLQLDLFSNRCVKKARPLAVVYSG